MVFHNSERQSYIDTLKQESNGTKAYEETSTDEKSVVNTSKKLN